jgi:hypothetical protein
MCTRHGRFLLLPLLCLGPRVFGFTLSFLVIETGLGEGGPYQKASLVWENRLLADFFDAGHIVSNAPILRMAEVPGADFPEAAREDFEEAVAGGADFFVLALLDYQGAPDRGEMKPRHLSLRLFRVHSRELIYRQDYGGASVPAVKEASGVDDAIWRLIGYLR